MCSARIRHGSHLNRRTRRISWARGASFEARLLFGGQFADRRSSEESAVAAASNGNGRAVLPPSALTPMPRYGRAATALGRVVGRILLGVARRRDARVALVAGVYLWSTRASPRSSAHSQDVKIAQKLLGESPRAGPAGDRARHRLRQARRRARRTPSRSDTLMLLRADPTTKSLSMLSFPRDLLVTIHCRDSRSSSAKINAAYADCGSKGALETVKHLTGLPINYLVTVNFRGFKQIVDGSAASGSTSTGATSTTTPASRRRTATRRSTSSPATSGSAAAARSPTCATGTPTPTSTGSRASSSS